MTTTVSLIVNDDSPVRCGPDCAYLHGACRCWHGEPAGPSPEWWAGVQPAY